MTDMEEYGRLKARIFENQQKNDVIVYNANDDRIKELVSEAPCKKWPFGIEIETDCGYLRDGNLIIKMNGKENVLVTDQQMKLKGEHNLLNGLAASLAVWRDFGD